MAAAHPTYQVLGAQDDVAESGHIGLISEFILWLAIVCTPYESKSVGPVTVTVQSVCLP